MNANQSPKTKNPDVKEKASVNIGVGVLWGLIIAVFCFLGSLKFYRIFDPSGTIWFISLGGFVIGFAYGYWHSAIGHKNK